MILDNLDKAYAFGCIIGFICCYIFVCRPTIKLKDEYIARLEGRLEERYK